jgi:HEAT repeat protein
VLLMGESSGDVLIPALTSRSPAVRHASALLLGRLRLRRAIAPLLRQLQQEESDLWTEIARALGEFGPSASRRVVTALRESKGTDQRFVLTLAHLYNHGCDREIEKLQKDSSSRVAAAARMAIAQRSKVQWEDLAVREQGKIADEEAVARLSQLFYSKAVIVQGEL